MSAKQPFFSVVITNHNSMKWLKKCLTSLKDQTFRDFEVVFVDNVSTDGSVEYVEKEFPWVRVFRNKNDLGFAGANNVGCFNAKGDYIILMNTDAYFEKNSFEQLSAELKKHPEYHLAQLDVRNYDKGNMDDPPMIFSIDPFGYPIGYGEIFYADGASLVITADLFRKLNGFDDKFYMYLEDMDLAWRAQMVGERVHFLKGIHVFHFTGGTSVSTQIKNRSYTTTMNRRYHAQKNNLRALIKNYSLSTLLWTLPVSILLASMEGFLYLLKRNIHGFIALHRSIWWNIVNLPDTIKEREKMQRMRTVSDSEILKRTQKTISKLHSYRLHGVPSMKV